MISKANEDLANRIGSFCYSIYNDGKRLTLSAFSWPSRVVANVLGANFNINKTQVNSENNEQFNLQYINPKMHAQLMTSIVQTDSGLLEKKISNSLAFSMRVDGSVDRSNIDKIYILGKIVNQQGELQILFMGIAIQKERFAKGLHKALKTRINEIGPNFYDTCIQKLSSFVTDGANVNVGEVNGLWALIDKDNDLIERENRQTTIYGKFGAVHIEEI